MNQRKGKKETAPSVSAAAGAPASGGEWLNAVLLGAALLAGMLAYWPALSAGWFYDDLDYIVHDPRLEHIELFMPGHWHDSPPAINVAGIYVDQLPGYGKPLIYDRFIWRLSFALERWRWGAGDTPAVAHGLNLAVHLACVIALFLALSVLLKLYAEEEWFHVDERWRCLPGIAALIFAVHPWTAEPVCYSTARSGSLGTLFVLLGVLLTAQALRRKVGCIGRVWRGALILLCALAAFGCKENFVSALPGCVLAVAPVLGRRAWRWSPSGTLWGAAVGLLLMSGALWLGIHASDRAQGLFAQSSLGRSWPYLFEIQSPLLLQTLADQLFTQRLSIEFNYPGWSGLACALALAANVLLLGGALWAGFRWPILLAVAWFYLHLLPSNSVLVRQDFLAARNVYLPAAGTAVFCAGGFLWLLARVKALHYSFTHVLRGAAVAGGVLTLLYWSAVTNAWADAFTSADGVWARSALIAPDHATVRLNYGVALLYKVGGNAPGKEKYAAVEREVLASLAAESSPTMQYHNPSHRASRRAVSYRILGSIRREQREFVEAEAFFQKSFNERPGTGVWVDWLEVALECDRIEMLQHVLQASEGLWPNGWWTHAMRGLYLAKQAHDRATKTAQAELQFALNAPDEPDSDLRRLQIRVILGFAKSTADPAQRKQWLERLQRLGVNLSEPPK